MQNPFKVLGKHAKRVLGSWGKGKANKATPVPEAVKPPEPTTAEKEHHSSPPPKLFGTKDAQVLVRKHMARGKFGNGRRKSPRRHKGGILRGNFK